jgi:tryptophan synthase alpha chain
VTPELMHAMVAGGADVIELGVPFSDPSADGPVIQKAGDKALTFGIGLVQVLAMVRTFRQTNTTTPVVLMGYANPVERYDQKHGQANAPKPAAVPLCATQQQPVWTACSSSTTRQKNASSLPPTLRAHGMDLIFLLAPTSPRRAWTSGRWPVAMCTTCRSKA